VNDRLFAQPRRPADFAFDEDTAEVFDDMLLRSVPGYAETERMLTELALRFLPPNGRIYDLGCSTGATLARIAAARAAGDVELIGVDNSEPMLTRADKRLHDAGLPAAVRWRKADIADVAFEPADVFIMNLTLQFIRPINRPGLLARVHDALRPGGCLLAVEKVLSSAPRLNRVFLDNYLAFKARNGYSELEIAQKRDALENVLVPYRPEENVELIRAAGFTEVDCFFRWYNFAGFIALRSVE